MCNPSCVSAFKQPAVYKFQMNNNKQQHLVTQLLESVCLNEVAKSNESLFDNFIASTDVQSTKL